MRRTRRGFTLIELLIVVVIIGILAAFAIPKFQSTKGKANAATLKSDLRNLATAQEAYFYDHTIVHDVHGRTERLAQHRRDDHVGHGERRGLVSQDHAPAGLSNRVRDVHRCGRADASCHRRRPAALSVSPGVSWGDAPPRHLG